MSKKVNIGARILSANEEYALKNSRLLAEQQTLCLNMISSPGSGKTTILARTITMLREEIKIGVIEGDIKTDIDAERIRATNAPSIQIETHGSCHLSAAQVSNALSKLPAAELDVIFIENVGNLVCPSAFELGENGKVVVLSVPEGDDKPIKYPAIFAKSKVLLINKIDMLEKAGLVDFDIERVKAYARKLNNNIKIFLISAKTGDGFADWCRWLSESVRDLQ
jgi:hydrogenase nickel incorporation protein HypB